MRQKAVALLIVSGIVGVMASVLYSPAALDGPNADPVALQIAPPIVPAPPAEVAAPAAAAIARRPALGSAPVPLAIVVAPRGAEQAIPHFEDPPSLSAAAAFVAVAPLAPSSVGVVPAAGTAGKPHRGVFEVAGRSIGSAFATTGRSLGTAFKRVF